MSRFQTNNTVPRASRIFIVSCLNQGSAVPVQMQLREFVETDELRLARKARDDLEEELRHAGLPPGWGR
jgi:hypothetical protein